MSSFDRTTILDMLGTLSDRTQDRGVIGDICLYGGGTMVLAFNARLSAQDLDAVFQPAAIVRGVATEIAEERGITAGWLNDGVKGWLSARSELVPDHLPQWSNLRLTRPTSTYLLAMKCLAARTAGFGNAGDKPDIIFLVRALGLASAAEVLKLVTDLHPEDIVLPKSRFLIEEIMDNLEAEGLPSR